MKETRLAFCDCSVMERWTVHQVAAKAKRRCREDLQKKLSHDVQILSELHTAGIKLACTVTAAAHVVTKFYKHGAPFTGNVEQFIVRKSLAREAATAIRTSIVLLSPSRSHFEMAEVLWWELCNKTIKQSFAQFEDYVEAALILFPPEKTAVTQVLVSHHHLEYLLHRKGSQALIQVLGPFNW